MHPNLDQAASIAQEVRGSVRSEIRRYIYAGKSFATISSVNAVVQSIVTCLMVCMIRSNKYVNVLIVTILTLNYFIIIYAWSLNASRFNKYKANFFTRLGPDDQEALAELGSMWVDRLLPKLAISMWLQLNVAFLVKIIVDAL